MILRVPRSKRVRILLSLGDELSKNNPSQRLVTFYLSNLISPQAEFIMSKIIVKYCSGHAITSIKSNSLHCSIQSFPKSDCFEEAFVPGMLFNSSKYGIFVCEIRSGDYIRRPAISVFVGKSVQHNPGRSRRVGRSKSHKAKPLTSFKSLHESRKYWFNLQWQVYPSGPRRRSSLLESF